MRPSWDEYFMDIAHLVKTRSTCIRRQVGAVVVKDKRILSTGYNGAPTGCNHCTDIGCMRAELGVPSGERHELCRALHAEQNAIAQAAAHGISMKDASIYVTTQPCSLCAKILINAGIREIIFQGSYPDELAIILLKEAGIKLTPFDSL
ncbi:MAG: cytidine/deoxycytidylate deaminase family protein [Cellulosilyticaceae bacterium]